MLEITRNKTYHFLRWTEKWIKTDMVYFTTGGFWLTVGQLFSSLSAFLLSIAFANLLPRETYGIYKYVLSIASILSIPTLSGISTALTQSVAKGFEGSLKLAIKTRIKWGLIGTIASLILAGYYFYQNNTSLTFSFLIVAIFLPFMDSFSSYEAVLIGKKLFKVNTKYNILIKVCATIITISTLYLTDNILLIVFSYFILYTTLRLIFLKITIYKTKLNNRQDQQIISYGKNLSFMDIIGIITSQLDKILIFSYLGAVELGIYAFAIAMPEQIKGIFKNIYTLSLPKFTQSNYKENRRTILIKMFKLSLVVLPIIIIYILAAPYIFKWFFPQYLDSVFYSQIFSISLLTLPNVFPVAFLQSQKAQKKLYQYSIVSPIIQIITLFILIYFFDLMGIVMARILNRFINLFFSITLIDK